LQHLIEYEGVEARGEAKQRERREEES